MNPQTMTPALTILSHSTFVDSIYHHLSVPDILSLHLVCRHTHDAARNWLPSAYNIENHLRRFFDDPLSFRVLQAITSTLVSGSNALQFFERSHYPGNDLDLYVPCRHTHTVAMWLQKNCYVFTPTEKQLLSLENKTPSALFDEVSKRRRSAHLPRWNWDIDENEYGRSSFEEVFTFNHKSNPALKVQLIIADPLSSSIACVLYFHSTLVMNFIAWDKAYSLFPAATFLARTCLTFGDAKVDPRLPSIYAKYWRRGFKISAVPLSTPALPRPFRVGNRWVDDQHSWIIDLPVEDVIQAGGRTEGEWNIRSAPRHAGFTLGNEAPGRRLWRETRRNPDRYFHSKQPVLYFNEIASPVLSTTLIVPLSPYCDRFIDVKRFLRSQEKFEQLEANELNLEPDFRYKITGLKYWDEEVLSMLQEKPNNGWPKLEYIGWPEMRHIEGDDELQIWV